LVYFFCSHCKKLSRASRADIYRAIRDRSSGDPLCRVVSAVSGVVNTE
jgi:hypothetical protein